MAGGVRALVRLAQFCNHEGVQEQVRGNQTLRSRCWNRSLVFVDEVHVQRLYGL